MFQGFWKDLKKPVVGLSPMDGVTDASMRFITKKYGGVDVLVTEFVSAEGIRAGALRLMKDFLYAEEERPVVAQIFGTDPDAFYLSSMVVCGLGFDGVDINMGCPAKNVASRGGGAGLIQTPELAKEIIEAVKRGVADWKKGISLKEIGLDEKILEYVEGRENFKKFNGERKEIPVSVKTRIGYDEPVVEEWTKILLSCEPAVIAMHGRTLKQRYSGKADWEELSKAAKLVAKTETLFLGNGDVDSFGTGVDKLKKFGGDGFLIGRAAMGNPWVFKKSKDGKKIDHKERFKVALEHARKYEEMFPDEKFLPMRKHLAWYVKGFDGAKELRGKLVRCDSVEEVEKVLRESGL